MLEVGIHQVKTSGFNCFKVIWYRILINIIRCLWWIINIIVRCKGQIQYSIFFCMWNVLIDSLQVTTSNRGSDPNPKPEYDPALIQVKRRREMCCSHKTAREQAGPHAAIHFASECCAKWLHRVFFISAHIHLHWVRPISVGEWTCLNIQHTRGQYETTNNLF